METKKNKQKKDKNTFIMKLLVFFGVLVFCFAIFYLGYHFFVKESDIKINISTDKQMEYLTINGNEELRMTQKYVSDLNYSMRYDIKGFKVFKYKKQDIFKSLEDERILVAVEKSSIPSNCKKTTLDTEYNNCYIEIDNYTDEYFISTNEVAFKITVKSPGDINEEIKPKIDYMLDNFTIEKK